VYQKRHCGQPFFLIFFKIKGWPQPFLIFAAPFIKRGAAHAVRSAKFGHRHAACLLFQNLRDLAFAVFAGFHVKLLLGLL
jgi:hypothetical protein